MPTKKNSTILLRLYKTSIIVTPIPQGVQKSLFIITIEYYLTNL